MDKKVGKRGRAKEKMGNENKSKIGNKCVYIISILEKMENENKSKIGNKCVYIISILVWFTNTYLFVMALIGKMHGYPQCYLRSRKDNVTRTLTGTKSLHPLPGVTLSDNTFLIVINPSNLWFSYSKMLLY